MELTYQDRSVTIPDGTPASECLEALDLQPRKALAVIHSQRLYELNDALFGDGDIRPLTLQDAEGRRIYERSARFILLMAVDALYPGMRLRFEFSVSSGVFVRAVDRPLTSRDIRCIERKMREIVEQDLPLESQLWKTGDAIAYFQQRGWEDKIQLLRYRTFPMIRMYGCGNLWEYFYGAMVPSTGYIGCFDLLLHDRSMILQLPNAKSPDQPAPYIERPRLMETFAQSARWCSVLGVNNVSDLSDLMEKRQLRHFIRLNEALHDQALVNCAQRIVQNHRRIVLVSGPSSSGKTTFAARLAIQLQVLGAKAYRVSLDNYYLDRDAIPREEDGSQDLEHIRTLDLPLLQDQVRHLLKGEEVSIPEFSFLTGKREKDGTPLCLGDNDIVILEGIHALNPLLSSGIPPQAIYRVFVSDLTCLNLDDHNRIRTTDMRLLRRIVRDHLFRNTSPRDTLAMWPSVRRGEETWVFPYQEQADTFFNTTLHYELPVLRHYAYELLREPDPSWEGYLLALRLRKTLNYIPDIDEDLLNEIPPLSLLREFIGGGTIELR